MDRTTSSTRSRLVPIGLAIVAALMFALSACGSDDGVHTASGDQAAAAATLPSTLEVVATDFTFTNDTGAVAAGPVTVRLTNDGQQAHQVMIGRTKGDLTPEQFVTTFHDQGELAALSLLDWAGGVNGTAPGDTQEATSILQSGNYLMVCFIPDADGVSHVMHNMVVPLQVGPTGDAGVPTAEQTITLADYSVTLPAGFNGQGTFEVRNTGQETHELILFRLQDGKSLDDLAAWSAGGMKGPPPYDYTGGVGAIAPSTSAWVPLGLRPGNYVSLCVVTSPTTMQQHVQMGMVTPFVIA